MEAKIHVSCRCSPEALQISESELRDVHEQFVRAVRDLAVTALAFRGKRYPIVRVEQAPQFHWWWAEPRAALKVLTETFKLSFHAPVKPPNAPPAYVSVDNDLAVDRPATKTIVRRRDILHNGGSASPALNRRHQKRCDTRAPAAAIVDGVVLRVPASALGVTPVEEAGREVGHAKFVFRHAYLKFYDLCPLCARNRSADCNGDIPPFCRPCWLSHDLNLYMSAAQAWLEYGMAPADLADAHTRYVDGARIGNKLYHKRGCITAHSASATPSAESSPAPSPDECASGPLAPDTPFYREFDVAYLAILKYGSSAAIAHRRDERAAAAAVALVADEAMLDVEALEQRREKGRKRRAATEEELDGNYVAGGRQAKVARRPKKAARRTPRKAARGKFYGEERDALDTRVDESTLGDILRWGVSVA